MSDALHTESRRRLGIAWIAAGGAIEAHPIRTKWRSKDVPAKLLSNYNAIQHLPPWQGAH